MSDDRDRPIDERLLGNRDAVSMLLGKLLGKVEAISEGGKERDRKLDSIVEDVEEFTRAFEKFEERYLGAHKAIEIRLSYTEKILFGDTKEDGLIKRTVDLESKLKTQKSIAIGAAAGATVAGGSGFVALVYTFLEKIGFIK